MKTFIITTIIAGSAIMFTSCKNAIDSDLANTTDVKEVSANTDAVTVPVIVEQSAMEWIGTKVSRHHHGEVKIKSGTMELAGNEIVGGNFVFDMQTIKVLDKDMDAKSISNLEGHLKNDDFFSVENNPEAIFVITATKPFEGSVVNQNEKDFAEISKYRITDPTHIIMGNLTIKGVTKGVEFPARVTIDGNKVEALAKFNIDRTVWNITYPGMADDAINNYVHIGLLIKTDEPAL